MNVNYKCKRHITVQYNDDCVFDCETTSGKVQSSACNGMFTCIDMWINSDKYLDDCE